MRRVTFLLPKSTARASISAATGSLCSESTASFFNHKIPVSRHHCMQLVGVRFPFIYVRPRDISNCPRHKCRRTILDYLFVFSSRVPYKLCSQLTLFVRSAWKPIWAEEQQMYYYYNESTRETQWVSPELAKFDTAVVRPTFQDPARPRIRAGCCFLNGRQ